MGKRLALSLWFVSILWLGCALAEEKSDPKKYLTEEDVRNREFVSNWLRTKGASVDQTESKWYFEQGMRENQKKNWSAATKAFGESMIRYPTPHALAEYADAELRMLGESRARENSMDQHKLEDMKDALDFYKSALAADAVLNTMSKQDRERVRQSADCLDAYIRSGKARSNCQPLEVYGRIR
jgi:hypothetical protein